MNNRNRSYNISILFIFTFVSIIFLSIGYAASNTEFMISGEAYVRLDADIRVTNIKKIESNSQAYETFNARYSNNTTKTFVTLPNEDSMLVYEVTITNKTGQYIIINDIVEILNDNENISYDVKNIKKNGIYNGEEIKFRIEISNNTEEEQIGTLELKYDFELYEVKVVCKRAGVLHSEECTQTDETYYCSGSGYTLSGSKGTTTITYGNFGLGNELKSGDAFDCDVTGNGDWERFYYVTSKTTTSTNDTAVLIYYNNTTNGVADNTESSLIAYNTVHNSTGNGDNWYGPETAYQNLPSTSQWSNSAIISPGERQITNQTGETTTNNENNTIQPFTYTDKAARLLTYQEVVSACGSGTVNSTGYLDNCNYLLENTKYSNSSMGTYGYWLETPRSSTAHTVWGVYGHYRHAETSSAYYANYNGVRPVIEVLKINMDLKNGVQAKHLYYDNRITGIDCNTVQCALDKINDMVK